MSPRLPRVRIACAGALLVLSASAEAKTQPFQIRPGPLGGALVQFGQQAGITVGLTDPALASAHSDGAQGRMTNRQALRRVLLGTGAVSEWIDSRTVRIAGERKVRPPIRKPEKAELPSTQNPAQASEIIVTASKRQTRLRDYAASVSILDLNAPDLSSRAAQGTSAIVARMPILASTNLGPGRNKLFIRGVADSSFSGFSQTTVGEYLGDVRLTYYAPDPNLNLYDMDRVEVLEGPQGTLYGTGGLGGIIRLIPNAPDFSRNAASTAAGAITVAHGAIGYDAAGMANLVLAPDLAALRVVAYLSTEPGYIDDPSRGLQDINRTKSQGGRFALALSPGGDWKITFGAAKQDIKSRDSQYVLRGFPPLQRSTVIAQPFDNDYALAYVTLEKAINSDQLTSTTSIVRHNVDNVVDATVSIPRKFEEDTATRLISHETRFSHHGGIDGWVAGVSGLVAQASTVRELGAVSDPQAIARVKNTNVELALFGQYSREVARDVSMTGGVRLSYAGSKGDVGEETAEETADPKRAQFQVSPMAAVSWQLQPNLLAFVHWQSAFRPGLLEVSPLGAANKAQRIEADDISTIELGTRYGQPGHDPIALTAALSYSRWSDIQADQIDKSGLPFTDNIGDGRIKTFEIQATWLARPSIQLDASALVSSSRLAKPAARFSEADEMELPNIPHFTGGIGVTYVHPIDALTQLRLNGFVRYVGSSDLGIGFPLDVSQGNYVDASLQGRISRGPLGLSVDIDNLLDGRGNRFAYGNPFTVEQRDQMTPLVPRRVRIGVDLRF